MAAITQLEGKPVVFVFGSNKSGIHGAGAAKFAREHFGAYQGCGEGLRNYSYAIPTKDSDINTALPLDVVHEGIKKFLEFAKLCQERRPNIVFHVTRIGCGYAAEARGQTQKEADAVVSQMFKDAPLNCLLPRAWIKHLPDRPVEAFWPHW
jgi:hypothetical protein